MVLKHFSPHSGASRCWGTSNPDFIDEKAEAWECSDITILYVPGLAWILAHMWSLLSKNFERGKLYIKATTGSYYVWVLCDSLGMCLYNWLRDRLKDKYIHLVYLQWKTVQLSIFVKDEFEKQEKHERKASSPWLKRAMFFILTDIKEESLASGLSQRRKNLQVSTG